jgi:hypothetical protein
MKALNISDYHTTSTLLPDSCCTEVAEPENDPVNHPSHYTSGSIECIDFIDSCGYGLDFCLANAIKYLTRCKLKGTCEQDIRKAIWYATHAADKIHEGLYEIE